MERTPTPQSSQIASLGYDAQTQTLEVEFRNSGGRPNSVYQYDNFPAEKWAEFQKAESIGSYHYRFIKAKYPFRKIS